MLRLQFHWFSCDIQFVHFSPYDGFSKTKHVVEFLDPEVQGSKLLRNVGKH